VYIDILVFVSGVREVPLLEFEKQPRIEFLDDPKSIFPMASTCELVLRIPQPMVVIMRSSRSTCFLASRETMGLVQCRYLYISILHCFSDIYM